jgi:type IV pilus biogenesis protein PilP
MQNYLRRSIFYAGLLLSAWAFAESASDRLTKIETETLLLKAREKQLEVQAKIVNRQSEIANKQLESDRLALPAGVGNPLIIAVEGIGKHVYATLQLGNGSMVDVQVGDVLTNGMRVSSIRPNEVIIENAKKQRTRLAIASQTPAAFDANFPSVGLRLPPLPPPSSMSSMSPKGVDK